jgi:hypothetical protein
MSEETLWTVQTNSDLTEGRGRQYIKHFCKLQATAIRLSKRGYVQGADCPVDQVRVLVLDGQRVLPASLINVEPPTKEDESVEAQLVARVAALKRAKELGLTDEELSAIRSYGVPPAIAQVA